MKNYNLILYVTALVALTSCGGKSSQGTEENNTETEVRVDENEKTIVKVNSAPGNSSEEYNQYFSINQNPIDVTFDGKSIEMRIKPSIKSATGQAIDYDNTEVILLDETGNKLVSLHSFGVNESLEEKLYLGTESDDNFTFINILDTEEKATEVAEKAKAYHLVMPFMNGSKVEKRIERKKAEEEKRKNGSSDSYFEIDGWSIPGTYEFSDEQNQDWKMILDEDRNIALDRTNGPSDGDPMKGTWKKSSLGDYVELSFPSGPLICIGGHMSGFRFALTSKHIYSSPEECEDGNPEQRVAVKKTN